MSVSFHEPELVGSTLSIPVKADDQEFEVKFTTPEKYTVDGDCLAAALMPLIGKRHCEFSFYVSEKVTNSISSRTGMPVHAKAKSLAHLEHAHPSQPPENGSDLLLFSGGVDSLAADLLIPNHFTKVGVNWNGRFPRETNFLDEMGDVFTFSSNIRDRGDRYLDWMFMASPALLLARHFRARSIGFGTVLEASRGLWISKAEMSAGSYRPSGADPRAPLGLFDSTITKGLTEFGTMLAAKVLGGEELLLRSINSAADVDSEKHWRKKLMLHATKARLLETDAPPSAK